MNHAKKPLIGLCPLYDLADDRLWMRSTYLDGIRDAGGIPIVLPLIDDPADIAQLATLCDAYLFTGGPDVHPFLFGEEVRRECHQINLRRDRFEASLLQELLKTTTPVLGICRGIQLVNVVLGGTLYQDIPSQTDTTLLHDQEKPYSTMVHHVHIEPESPLYAILGKTELMVNSLHHQAVKDLAPALRACATASDGICECAYLPDHPFFLLTQWHPEFAWEVDLDSRKILHAFVEAAG